MVPSSCFRVRTGPRYRQQSGTRLAPHLPWALMGKPQVWPSSWLLQGVLAGPLSGPLLGLLLLSELQLSELGSCEGAPLAEEGWGSCRAQC